ncbi:hypothetical protein FW774_13965 [Pedobacter sp. BS3]|uniref:baeRF7 domain-containing protein n=1 Tax=Pedobacter sp. BS3 TaxID=2567937 RepID=UPI0011EF651B|nr:hypothetical protein [Pedobacter sp. BS3]TZF82609.1 hypothetical protein FW774_13965 [Pedobacter sp. BS3]
MEEISVETLKELAGHETGTCISIFIPTHRSGVEVNEMHDAILLKSNLQQAAKTLTARGKSQAEVNALLEKGFDLVNERSFWNTQSDGLAAFVSENFFRYIQLPVSPKEELYINNSFYIMPLLNIKSPVTFYLLVLSRHDATLYKGDNFTIQKIEVDELPNGMDDVIHYEEKGGKQLMRRAGAGTGRNAVSGTSFHGHGAGVADDTMYLLQYLKEVDQTLWTEVLSTSNIPLMLAGVDYIIAHYRQISHYKYITGESLPGNYEYEPVATLYNLAKEKLAAYFYEPTRKALKNFYDQTASGLSSYLPQDVIPAAYYGKVSDLFVQKDEHIWGHFNEVSNTLTIHDQKEANDSCLINKAAVKTIMNGGEVHILEKEKMPSDTRIAAFMRY